MLSSVIDVVHKEVNVNMRHFFRSATRKCQEHSFKNKIMQHFFFVRTEEIKRGRPIRLFTLFLSREFKKIRIFHTKLLLTFNFISSHVVRMKTVEIF